MPTLIVKDVDTRLDGEYECQLDDLTNREFHLIRQMSGIAPTGVVGGLLSGDVGLVVALATVVLERQGKTVNVEALWDAQHGSLVFDFASEDDAVPPEQPPSGGNDSENNGESESASTGSGGDSTTSSGSQPAARKATGKRG